MINNELEIARRKLYDLIINKASYEDILRQSQVIDIYIVKLMKSAM